MGCSWLALLERNPGLSDGSSQLRLHLFLNYTPLFMRVTTREALSLHTRRERAAGRSRCAECSRRVGGGSPCPSPPFLCYFSSPLLWYSGIHSDSWLSWGAWERGTRQLRLRKSTHSHALSSLCRITSPRWMELAHFQSTPETAKNDRCYLFATTTCETRKADVFILPERLLM